MDIKITHSCALVTMLGVGTLLWIRVDLSQGTWSILAGTSVALLAGTSSTVLAGTSLTFLGGTSSSSETIHVPPSSSPNRSALSWCWN